MTTVQSQPADPVSQIMTLLQNTGHETFTTSHRWESALCALLLALEPRCKTYRLMESLPYHKKQLDKIDMLNSFAHLGYYARPVTTKLADLDERLLPCLFITQNNNPVVILEKTAFLQS